MEFTGDGELVINADITGAAGVAFNSTGAISLGADVTAITAAAAIFVDTAAITLTDDVFLTTNDGAVTLDEVLTDAAGDYVLTIAAGDVLFKDNVGLDDAAVGGVAITSSGDVTFIDPSAGTVDVTTLTIAAAGAVTFNADVDVTGLAFLTCETLNLNAPLNAGGAAGSVTVTNGGTAVINGGITSTGIVRFNGTGPVELGADISVTGLGAGVVISDSVLLLTGDRRVATNSGSITLDEIATDTALDHVLTLAAGSAGVSIDDNAGIEGTPLGGVTIESAGTVRFVGADAAIDAVVLDISLYGRDAVRRSASSGQCPT